MTQATLSRRIRTYTDGTWSIEEFPVLPTVQWYMQKEDRDVFGSIRTCAPCPAIFVMKDDQHAKMDQQWQYYLRGINYNMTIENVYLLLDWKLAFANRLGFRNPNAPKADYFHNDDLSYPVPALDKVRTTSRSVMTGSEQFSLVQSVFDAAHLARTIVARRTSFMGAKSSFASIASLSENVLNVDVFDSRQPPPLKPGYSYPSDISLVNPDAYMYMPETHPEMFMVANTVNREGLVVQFPRGAIYPWIDDGLTPYSFVPHVANLGYGDVLYPMRNLLKVPLGSPKPRALRYS